MKKSLILLTALICASFMMPIVAVSEIGITSMINYDNNAFIKSCIADIESAEVSNSFAAKQVILYDLDFNLNRMKIELQDALKQYYTKEQTFDKHGYAQYNWDNYVRIQKVENKIKAINIVLAKLNDTIAKIEKQFSIPAGQFKLLAAQLAKNPTYSTTAWMLKK